MKRIAFFGPLPPSHTGIADYDEALLPHLRKHYEIDVFVQNRLAPEGAFHHGAFYRKQKQNPYDAVVYQVGNDFRFHEYIYAYLFQFPGAIVFHDYCLHHSRAGMLLRKGLRREYREELSVVYPDAAEKISNAVITGSAGDLLFFLYPFSELLLRSALSAGAHTDAVVRKLQGTETPVVKIPLLESPVQVEAGPDPLPGKFVIGSFGLATRAKRIPSILHALVDLRQLYPKLHYVIVGEAEAHYDLAAEVERYGIRDTITVTGRTSTQDFLRWMSRVDIVINLRYPSAGEMSATLIRALTCGKPVLISRLESLQEIPKKAAMRVRPDHEAEDVFHCVSALIENEHLRKELGAAAHQYIDKHHRPEQAVEKYQELIDLAIHRKPGFHSPDLPLHLRDGREILREYIRKTSFQGKYSSLLDWIL